MKFNAIIGSFRGLSSRARNAPPKTQQVSLNMIRYQEGVDEVVLKAYLDNDPKKPILVSQSRERGYARQQGYLLGELYDPVRDMTAPLIGQYLGLQRIVAYALESGRDEEDVYKVAFEGLEKGLQADSQYGIGCAQAIFSSLPQLCSARYDFWSDDRARWRAHKVNKPDFFR